MLGIMLIFFTLKVLPTENENKISSSNLTDSRSLFAQNLHMIEYSKLLQDIYEEQKFESILLVYHKQAVPDALIMAMEKLPVPKVLVTETKAAYFFRGKFNVNILAILLIDSLLDLDLMETLAITLDYMRQTRILAVVMDVEDDKEQWKQQLLLHCKSHNMTNVVLKFMNSQEDMELDHLYMLKPYPKYHWILKQHQIGFYQQHWKNMQNVSLLTFVDKAMPRAFYFKDEQGNWRINGYVARLILLFAERFNASLRMAYPLSLESPLHYSVILKNMVRRNLLDIPMVQDTSPFGSIWLNFTYVYDYDQGIFIVPCARELSTREVYTILLNVYFLGSVFVSTILLSLLHSLVDYMFDDLWQPLRLLFSDRIFPGVLGQSFAARYSTSKSLQIVYILLFIVGLYLNTQFSVEVSTLLTSPPQHRQLETMQDIMNSPLKILLHEAEAADMSPSTTNFAQTIETTSNNTYLREIRQHFNTSYCYYTSWSYWKMLTKQQQFYSHKVFCTFENLTLFPYLPWAIPLQLNSPYTEALNYLIHQVEALGFKEAWLSSTFSDLLKLKQISLRDPYVGQGPKALTTDDLFWTWILLSSGLLVSSITCLVEIFLGLYGNTEIC